MLGVSCHQFSRVCSRIRFSVYISLRSGLLRLGLTLQRGYVSVSMHYFMGNFVDYGEASGISVHASLCFLNGRTKSTPSGFMCASANNPCVPAISKLVESDLKKLQLYVAGRQQVLMTKLKPSRRRVVLMLRGFDLKAFFIARRIKLIHI